MQYSHKFHRGSCFVQYRARDVSLLLNVQTISVAHPDSSCSPRGGKRVRDLKLTTHLNLVPMLRISGAMPLLSHCFYVVHGDNFTFTKKLFLFHLFDCAPYHKV
jgi:hypothetical protein